MISESYKHNCAACPVREACQHTFARYWYGKSHGGVGCNRPTGDERWAAEVMRVIYEDAARRRADDEAARVKAQRPTTRRDTSRPSRETWNRYAVIHKGKRHETTAKSEAGAINFIRYKLYGMTPLDQCPPFSVERVDESLPAKGTKPTTVITKDDILRRLARMTK